MSEYPNDYAPYICPNWVGRDKPPSEEELLKFKIDMLEERLEKQRKEHEEEEEKRREDAQEWIDSFGKQARNGLTISFHTEPTYAGNVITQLDARAEDVQASNEDVQMNVKEDEENKGMFKVRLMSSNINAVVGSNGEELPVIKEVIKEVPVEVIKEVEVIREVDNTDQVQVQQLSVLNNIQSMLDEMKDEIKVAKYQDALDGIAGQLSVMQDVIRDAESKDVLENISSQLSSMVVERPIGYDGKEKKPHLLVVSN